MTTIISESQRLTMTEKIPGGADYDETTAKVLADAMGRTIARSSDRVKAACQTTTPSGAAVDPLAVLDHHEKQIGEVRVALGGGFDPAAVREALNHAQKGMRQVRTAVSALIARNADLKSDNDAAISIIHEEIAKFIDVRAAGGALASEDTPTFCARLVAERDALIVRNAELDAERTILIDERDQFKSDYLAAIDAKRILAADKKALREKLSRLRKAATEMCDATGGNRDKWRGNLLYTLTQTSAETGTGEGDDD